MARDEFDSAGEHVLIKDLEGELVLFTPLQHVKDVATSFGVKDAVIADLVVLTQDGQPEHEDVMVFQGMLIAALKRRIKTAESIDRDPVTGVVTKFETTTSRRVLGVISKGEAKKGQSAPFTLGETTEAHKDLARAYVAANPTPAPVRKVVGQYVDAGVTQAAPSAPTVAQVVSHVGQAVQSGSDVQVSNAAEFVQSAVNAAIQVSDDNDPFAV